MVGISLDASGRIHAFVWNTRRRSTSIDAPGFPITIPWGINNQGQIVGLIAAQLPLTTDTHGFVLRRGAGGR